MIADIIVLGVMALCIFLGYARGLIHVAVRVLGFIIAVVVALILYVPISNYVIDNTDAVSGLQSVIKDKFYGEEKKQIEDNKEVQEGGFAYEIEKYVKDSTEEIKNNSVDYISKEIAVAVVRGVTWIGLFVAVRIVMIFVKALSKVIEKIPVIKQFNKVRRNNLWCA